MFKNSTSLATGLAVALAILFLSFVPLQAATLGPGSGAHLPIPGPNPGDPGGQPLARVAWPVSLGFDGTWIAPALPAWIGTLSATGPIPSSSGIGIVDYDFSTLPTGHLPANTIFALGDLDGGSQLAERIDLTAYDTSNNVINLWLDEPIGIWGSPWPAGSDSVPGWDWNTTTTNAYHFTGGTVTGGNPSLVVAMLSNQPIARLLINKHTDFFGFGLRAPEVPEPSTIVLLALGAVCLMAIRSRRGK